MHPNYAFKRTAGTLHVFPVILSARSRLTRRWAALGMPFAICSVLLATGCSSIGVSNAESDGAIRGLPVEVIALADRIATCIHFSGEINGDRSDRDQEIFAKMDALRCKTVGAEERAMRSKYSSNQDVQDALSLASQL